MRLQKPLNLLRQIFTHARRWASHAKRWASRENLWALVLCLVVILLIIFTADSSPLWIYQGF
jgi:type II secretory pathway component PulL